MNDRQRPTWIAATVGALVVMITWTVVVKYLVPLLFEVSVAVSGESAPASEALRGAGVMWDFWPLTHLLLAVGLWRRHRFVWAF